MTERIVFPEFRNEFEGTRYPFADTTTLTSVEGLTLPINTFEDAAIYPIGGQGRMYLSRIIVETRLVTLIINDERNVERCSTSFDPLDPPDLLQLTDAYDREAGILVSTAERLAIFNAWDLGSYTFGLGATEFVASVTIPTPEVGVRGILTEAGELLTGDVWLVGDRGVVLRAVNGNIRVDIVGDPLYVRDACSKLEIFNPPNFIKTINGCPPDEFGEFHLVAGNHLASDTILRIVPTAVGTLRIEAEGRG